MSTFRPSGISIKIREDLVEGSSRTQTTLVCDPIITLDGHRVAMSDIGDICFAKLDQGTSNEEIMSFTGITDNTTTYTLTGCVWGYNFYNTTSGVSANMKRHVSGSGFVITNDDHFLFTQFVNSDANQTIAGTKTFSSVPVTTGGDPITGNELTRKAYVDALVLGTLTTINVIVPGKAGETVSAGDLVYFDDTDNEWKLCDADTAATVNNVLLGIAQGSGTNGNAIDNGVLLQGVDANQSGLTEGDTYYASNTAGAIANSAGTIEVTVGIGKSATELYFNPRFNQQLTEDQQDALAGTSGTPSATNKYVTNDDTATAATANKVVRRGSSGDIAGVDVVDETAGETINGGTLPVPVFLSRLIETTVFTSTGSTRNVGDDTTNYRSQSFTTGAADYYIEALTLKLHKTGSPTGNLAVEIYAASGDNPTGSALSSVNFDVSTLTGSATDYKITFSSPLAVSPSTKYVLRLFYDGDVSNYVVVTDSNAGYSGGAESYSTNGSSWTAQTGYDIYFKLFTYATYPGRVFATDANDTNRLLFDGFAVTNATDGNSITVKYAGVVSGFSGLIQSKDYFVTDTVGTIDYTSGTYFIGVGIAISSTQILIRKDSDIWVSTETKTFDGSSSFAFTMPVNAKKAIFNSTWTTDGGVSNYYSTDVLVIKNSKISSQYFIAGRSGNYPTFLSMSLSGNTITVSGFLSGATNSGTLRMYYYR